MTPLISPLGTSPAGPFDAAVVIPTVLRPTLERAVRSVFAQRFAGTIQILLGVDARLGDAAVLDRLAAGVPANCGLWLCDPGYSTAARNGGAYPAGTGGSLRTMLSYAARSRRVAYLDDDNWWGPDHLATLAAALDGRDWAWSLRWFADADAGRPLCVDRWESVGPGAGVYADRFGGFTDPSCLMIDAAACEPVFRLWCRPLPGDKTGMSSDRPVFDWLKERPHGATCRATAFYTINPSDPMHPRRLQWIAGTTESTRFPDEPGNAGTEEAADPASPDELIADLAVASEFWGLASRFADIEGLLDPREGYLLYRLAAVGGTGAVVGIGMPDRRAAAWLEAGMTACGQGKVYFADTFQGSPEHHSDGTALDDLTRDRLERPGLATADADWPVRLLCVNMGGDAAADARAGFDAWERRLTPGAFAAFHEAGDRPGTGEMIGEILRAGRWTRAVDTDGVCVLQRVAGLAPQAETTDPLIER